jgi:hypothetical protein
VLAVCVLALVCAGGSAAARADAPTTQEVTITASGGVQLACEFVFPAGTAPDGGWPGLVLFPGLGAAPTSGTDFAAANFASVSCDERGTGSSAGDRDLAGPADAQDAQAIYDWLAARPEVSDTEIGAEGEDLGGAEVWNAAVAGVPFKAIVPADTWSSLATALTPSGGLNVNLGDLLHAWAPSPWNTAPGIAARSYLSHLHSLTVPTLIVHERKSLLVDLSQATTAYRQLSGPKRLFIGWAASPVPEAVAWFTHYLAGGKAAGSGVEIQHEQPDAATTTFPNLPPTRSVTVNLPGRAEKRSVRLPGGPLETFGSGSITIRYSDASWTQAVARVTTADNELVTEGIAPIKAPDGVLKIHLLNEAVLLPRGKKLIVTLMRRDDEFHGSGGGTGSGKITVGRITLRLSVLQRAVSR